jgi:hypothetical protein
MSARQSAKQHFPIPVWNSLFHQFHYNQEWFMQHYHKQSNVETTFSMIKAKFGGSLRSKTYEAKERRAAANSKHATGASHAE